MPLSVCPSGVYVFLKNHELKNVIIFFFIVCLLFFFNLKSH